MLDVHTAIDNSGHNWHNEEGINRFWYIPWYLYWYLPCYLYLLVFSRFIC